MHRALAIPFLRVFLVFSFLAAAGHAGPVERVPQDGSLTQAIQRVSNEGTILVSAGTYPVPNGGFRIRNPNKSFTVQAVDGAEVIIDGGGSEPLFLIEDRDAHEGRRIAFEGITFRDGSSDDPRRAGGITVDAAAVELIDCEVLDNEHLNTASGGGGVQVRNGGWLRTVHTDFRGNTAVARGGAIHAIEGSLIDVTWAEATDNRTDLPGHFETSLGGFIFLLNSELNISYSTFEDNNAGYLGGVVYAFGSYDRGESPIATVTVKSSTFISNQVIADPCCTIPLHEFGGALYAEDDTQMVVLDSRFEDNTATWGGAIAVYRSELQVFGSVFEGNRSIPSRVFPDVPTAGGAINITSADLPDNSTNGGVTDRPNASLVLVDSRLTGADDDEARQGGCLFASGDVTRLDGVNLPQSGDPEDHRSPVVVDNVIFDDCDVDEVDGRRALGGAIHLNLADLQMTDSLVVGSDALGDLANGGGLAGLNRSLISITDSSFAENTAEAAAGAVLINNSTAMIDNVDFINNDVSPGVAELIQNDPGAGIVFSANARNVDGFVSNSYFSGNLGVPILDQDRVDPPYSEVVFNGNEVHTGRFGDIIYKNTAVDFGGSTAAELNALNVSHSDGQTIDKSTVNNTRLTSAARRGRLIAAPVEIASLTPPGDPEPLNGAFLGYAWSGGPNARVGDTTVTAQGGVEMVTDPGTYNLRVVGNTVDSKTLDPVRCGTDNLLCLNQERFLVEIDWRDAQGNFGKGLVVEGGPDDSGLYFFFSEDNWEVLVKVLNGCRFTNHFWVFAAATTDIEYTLRVTDVLTGTTARYFNPLGNASAAITDTEALALCDSRLPDSASPPTFLAEELSKTYSSPVVDNKMDCTNSDTVLCVNRERFKVEVDWQDNQGNGGMAEVSDLRTADSGLFYFFNENNLEMLVKILRGCSINDRYWVFAAATTTLEYTLKVTDTQTNETVSYFNPFGRSAPAVTDVQAFATCP